MKDYQGIIESLEGVMRDIRGELLVLDTDIDLDDYIETMIEGPIFRARSASELGDDDGARLGLEVAVKDLLTDFDAEVLISDSSEFTTEDYADTVLRPLVTTTCGLEA
jgi:hypothetical protein